MPNKQTCILAIDLGTSGPKVALVTPEGEILSRTRRTIPIHFLPDGGIEQSPDDWWQSIREATRQVLAESGVAREAVAAVYCASLYSTTLPVDPQGQPLMNAILWMDTRGAPYVAEITRGWIRIQRYGLARALLWISLTGGVPTHSGKDSIAHILFLKHERPEIYRETYKFLEPKDYINFRLTGKFGATYDSMILHWLTDNRNIARIDYHPYLLALAGLEREKFPDLYRATDVLGTLIPAAAAEMDLPAGIPVLAGSTDAHSAAIGAGAVRDYEAHLYLGTSSWISCHLPFKKTDLLRNMASLPSAIPNKYYLANEQECAGVCLDFLRDSLFYAHDALGEESFPSDVYRRLDRLAAEAPVGSEGIIFAPWLVGERTPVEDALIRGGFFNLSLRVKRHSLVRAVFEGVALNARWLLDGVETFLKRRIEHLRMVGGGAQSDIWCQIHADILGRPILQVKEPIWAGVRGAGLLGWIALGQVKWEDIPERVPIAATFVPDPSHHAHYQHLYREFRQIYRTVRPICARLNQGKNARSKQ